MLFIVKSPANVPVEKLRDISCFRLRGGPLGFLLAHPKSGQQVVFCKLVLFPASRPHAKRFFIPLGGRMD